MHTKKVRIMTELNLLLHQFLGFISRTKLFGWLPLDIVLHSVIGLILSVILLKKKHTHFKVLCLVFLIAVAKEVFDSFSLTASIVEAVKDILITISFPLLAWSVSIIKKKLDS